MLIGDNSPLRRLPSRLNIKHSLFLNAIRYSVEISDLAHGRLQKTLHDLSVKHNNSKLENLTFPSAFLDAWAIIDSLHRLRCLLDQCPGIKQKSPKLRIFKEHTAEIEPLRHFVQHVNLEIYEMTQSKLPVLGVLSWFVPTDPDCQRGFCCSLIPGTMFEGAVHPMVNPAGKTVTRPVGLITLTANKHSICLSDAMMRVEQITRDTERQLESQFKQLPHPGADLFIRAHVKFGDAT